MRRLGRTASTQDVVRRAAVCGAPEGFCCMAGEQLAGRGRLGRSWAAPAGSSLLATVLIRRSPAVAPGLPFAAGLALVDSLRSLCDIDAKLKWPNDLLVDGRKLAGILCEVERAASTHDRLAVAVGVGVNLTVTTFPAGSHGISAHELAPPPDASQLLDRWLHGLAARIRRLEHSGIPGLRGEWLERATGLGERVRVAGPSGEVAGVAADVDGDGALVINTDSGPVRVLAGDVHLAQAKP